MALMVFQLLAISAGDFTMSIILFYQHFVNVDFVTMFWVYLCASITIYMAGRVLVLST